jgi:uncharacterized membrane protein
MVTMIVLLVILIITFIIIVGAGLFFLQIFTPKKTATPLKPGEQPHPAEKSEAKTGIRWSYFILPVALLLISIVITIYFYGKLPDTVTWRFNSDNSPTISRSQIALWAIVPQLFLTLLAIIITYGGTKIDNLFSQTSSGGIKLDTILIVMSNMVILPQLVLIVAILNIFNYNSFQTHINFISWFSLAIIIAGVFFLSIFFVNLIRKMRSQSK